MKKLMLLVVTGVVFAAQAKMNILVLTVDDMNCDSIGVFGCVMENTTPNIDRFAEDGFRSMHAHVHATSCIPSRNVVQTGRYLYNSGIEGFYQLPKDQVTYKTTPDFMHDAGYFTMIRGKSSHSEPYYPYPGWDINWDNELKEKHINIRDTKTFYEYTKKGVEAAKAAGKPFYFSMDIHDPHTPFYSFRCKKGKVSTGLNHEDIDNPPSRIWMPDEIIMPKFLPDTPLSRREIAAYYNSVRRADDSFGNVMKALKDEGVYDNTLIIFFSDHGMGLPFAKTAMYYHSSHTPLMVRWPGVTKPGSKDDDDMIGTVDILPTLLEITGQPRPEGLDGRSFASLLKGGKQDNRDYVYVMYEENIGGHREPARAVISKDYMYIENLWSDGKRTFATATKGTVTAHEMKRLADGGDAYMQKRNDLFNYDVPEQFFDLKKDSDCLHNFFDQPEYKPLIAKYQAEMVKIMKTSKDPMLDIYQHHGDKDAVEVYLAQLDAESKARRMKPEIYKRRYSEKFKTATPASKTKMVKSDSSTEGTTLEEHIAQAEARAKSKGKAFDRKHTIQWFQKKDTNQDGVMSDAERKAKIK